MVHFKITDYSYESSKPVDEFKATIMVINDRRIYAEDFEDEEE